MPCGRKHCAFWPEDSLMASEKSSDNWKDLML